MYPTDVKYLYCIMKAALYITAAVLFCISCQNKNDSSTAVAGQYQVKKALLKDADSTGMQPMAAMVDAAFHHTNCNSSGASGIAGLPYWEKLAETDSSFKIFYSSLTGLHNEFDCLRKGECQLVDINNSHILAYTAKDEKQELLMILNFDEDNRAVKAQYKFMDMPLLLGNYDNGAMPVLTSSLVLRPYEVRIYRVN
jgi:hypothetical protein